MPRKGARMFLMDDAGDLAVVNSVVKLASTEIEQLSGLGRS
jgi:hypothetical protein